ncbi:MAG TPA: RluA family pseudouridine synthase [Hyphomonadaceae bacterium]|nr:RluA family pseudouridine synthase [Hyphomonadaceae bacterium]HPN04162.1 RluA family pseudouridine synthase [Hyphomonadaceae bacterium]
MTPDNPHANSVTAPAEAEGARLDKWLADAGIGMSRSRLRILIEEGRVTVNGQPATDPSAKVVVGATYEIDRPAPVGALPEPENIPLDVVFEDKHLIIIDKPPGLVVHPAGGSERGTLVNALLYHCGEGLTGIGGVARPGIVHRLDKDTSGVMVAAKSEAAHTALTAMFAAHDIERVYLAVTRGAPRPLIGRIETNIARSPSDRKKMAVVKDKHFRADHWSNDPTNGESAEPAGKIAITNYRGIETFGRLDHTGTQPAAALVECRLETGRTHQIRVHMAHIQAPVLGDQTYGKHRWLKADGKGAAFERATATAKAFERQALHAAVLGFEHPITKKPLRFERAPPADMADLIDALRAMPT